MFPLSKIRKNGNGNRSNEFSFGKQEKIYFSRKWAPDSNVISNKIIVSNKLLGLLRLGLGFGPGFLLYA